MTYIPTIIIFFSVFVAQTGKLTRTRTDAITNKTCSVQRQGSAAGAQLKMCLKNDFQLHKTVISKRMNNKTIST